MGQETIGDASNHNNKPVESQAPTNPNDPTLAEMEAWGGAMLRAITGDETLQWSGQTLYAGTMPQVLPAAHHSNVPVALVDVRSQCPVNLGRRLGYKNAYEMLLQYKKTFRPVAGEVAMLAPDEVGITR